MSKTANKVIKRTRKNLKSIKEKLQDMVCEYESYPRRKELERRRDNLPNHYIRKLISSNSSLGGKDIPDEVVELYRNKVILERKIKELQYGEKQSQSAD